MPSYLLCPVGSDEGGVRGINRVELGEEVDNARNMRMGDLAIPPGPYQMQGIDDVLSVIETNLAGAVVRSGSKACNVCHTNPIAMPDAGDDALSDRIDAFGEFELKDLHPCVISSDEPGRRVAPGHCPGDPVTEPHRQSLPEICDCIETALSDPSDVGDNLNEDHDEARVALALCRALAAYQRTRGVCGAMRPDGPSSSQSGPACTEPGSPCDPFSGELLQPSVGFVCQSTGTQAQCLSETVCGAYSLRGGGKFLHDKAVSMLRIDVAGSGGIDSPVNVQDSLDIAGSLSAFDYRTRTRVEIAPFTFVEGTTLGSGEDFSASGEGKALVNGVPSDVRVVTTRSGDVVSFQIFRTGVDPEQLLFEGTGEAARSGIGFEISVP